MVDDFQMIAALRSAGAAKVKASAPMRERRERVP